MSGELNYDRRWPIRRFVFGGSLTLLLLGAGFGSWATMANISGAIIAPGRIQEGRARQSIQHPTGGVVSKILVRDGDLVAANAPLIELDDVALRNKLNIVEIQLFEIMARRARLIAERDQTSQITFDPLLSDLASGDPAIRQIMAGQRQLLAARALSVQSEAQALAKKSGLVTIQIAGMDAQMAAAETQLSLISDQLSQQQALLDRGLTKTAPVLLLKREAAVLNGRIGALEADRAQARERIAAIEIELLSARAARREQATNQLRDMEFRENELAERRRALLFEMQALVLRAPQPGVVLGLQISAARAVIKPAQPLMQIIPQDRRFVVTARIAASQVDRIYLGQSVRIRIGALYLDAGPEISGILSVLSADALLDGQSQTAFYRAEITLSESAAAYLSTRSEIVPGMPVQAYFRTTAQPVWAYLAKPLTTYFSRAFRES
ncbi:MAG: HlyD family type I secretion periplasmic adaptor subunit [Paracoccaceae bacterium]